jgi:putative ABC transport system permease protein
VLTYQLALPVVRYRTPDAVTRFVRQLEQAMQAMPGVEAAGIVNQIPLDQSMPNGSTRYWTRATAAKSDAPIIDARVVTPGYFDALHVRVVAGRPFEAADDETRPLVAIVDESLARRAWPGGDPIGQEIGMLVPPTFQLRWGRVVGVVAHLRQQRITADVREQIFVPFLQTPRSQLSVVLRTGMDADAVVRNVAAQIQTIDADLAPARVQRLDRLVDQAHAPARLNMMLAMLFSALSLLMTSIGLYGLVSYSVSQRRSELGVRAALGATDRDLVRLVLHQGLTLTMTGVVLGMIGSIAIAYWLRTLLYGVTAFDPVVYLTVPIVLGVIALLASYAPARRVVGMDPKIALRAE